MLGICVVGQGLTKSFGGLVACRFLMGVFESGFVPGAAYLIGCYYTQDEFLKRYAVFFAFSIIAGAFNGVSDPSHLSNMKANYSSSQLCCQKWTVLGGTKVGDGRLSYSP